MEVKFITEAKDFCVFFDGSYKIKLYLNMLSKKLKMQKSELLTLLTWLKGDSTMYDERGLWKSINPDPDIQKRRDRKKKLERILKND